jgi:DNA-binding beta-propeller fold protein YncE
VALLDTESFRAPSTIEVGAQPWHVAMTGDQSRLIAANQGDRTLSIIDVALGREVSRLPGASDVVAVRMTWFDSTAVVLSRAEKTALVVDLIGGRLLGQIALPGAPAAAVTTSDGTKMLVALSDSGDVAVIEPRELRLDKVIEGVVEQPLSIIAAGSRNTCS